MTVKNPRPLCVSQVTVTATARDNRDGPRRCVNTAEGLTHSSGTSREEGLGMKPTHHLVGIHGDSLSGVAS